ncbi:MAG: chloride channel protein family [Clostridia bacterium]|nr:chloride channel protein family [Clostridia bacterium]
MPILKGKLRRFNWLNSPVLLAVIIGLGGGLFAYVFRQMIALAQSLFFGQGERLAVWLGSAWVIIVPALGGLIVGPLVYFFAREAKGHGVPEVMESVAFKGGRIRMRVILIKAIASATCIGSGGSVGREGPIIQMGSAIGSAVGQLLKVSERMLKTMVGCGAAAGIAATFNTPMAGVIFAQEVILGEFTASNFGLLVLSSVTASIVSRSLLGDYPAFIVPAYQLHHPVEMIFYIILGLVAGVVGVAFTKLLYAAEDFFDGLQKLPPYFKPVLGGVAIGLIGWRLPQVFGVGYETVDLALTGKLTLGLLVVLLVAKLVATSLTLGSGGSGGIFAPSLFMGSMLGGTVGTLVHSLYPTFTAASGAYALVGMGAMVAASTQAPIQAILIVFEMTRDYRIILPLMTACVVSAILARRLSKESIYTMKLARRGVFLRGGRDLNVLKGITVAEAMSAEVVSVRSTDTLGDVVAKMQQYRFNGFPVLDPEGRLQGIITLADVRNTCPENPQERLRVPVAKVMHKRPYTISPEASLEDAFQQFALRQVEKLLVVDDKTGNLVGILTMSDVVSAYNRKLLQRESTLPRAATKEIVFNYGNMVPK